MKRVVLIGPGNIEKHFFSILKYTPQTLDKETDSIASALSNSECELALLPDKGISLEIAKKFKKLEGKVIALAPISDKFPGISHLIPYIEEKIDGKPLFDETIDTGQWPETNQRLGLYGDIILQLGDTPGADGERDFAVYMYKVMKGLKQNVSQDRSTFNKETRAGLNFPFVVIIYSPFTSAKLSPAIESHTKDYGVNLVYASSPIDLKNKIKKI